MDNDFQIVKFAKKHVKQVKFAWEYRNVSIMSAQEGNQQIAQRLRDDAPFAVLRAGATEMRCVEEYLKHKTTFSRTIKREILGASGVFPPTDEVLQRFCALYVDDMAQADIIALWGVGAESKVVKKYCNKNTAFTDLCALEPYYFDAPWSAQLEGKKLLIVHPFASTIQKQLSIQDALWANKTVLPKFARVSYVKAVQSNAGAKPAFDSWFDALDFMKAEIDKIDFDVAIIGAGAYGLPLAVYCKQLGKQVVQMSGATQILFGIKGKRWDTHSVISGFYNEFWVRPDESETPPEIERVEGGSYW